MGPTDVHSAREQSAPQAAPQPLAPADFAAEYQRVYRVLWVVAAGVLGRSAGAEDIVQEAAVLALGKLEQFQPGTHFAAWMARMVRFIALNQLRKQTRSSAVSFDEREPVTSARFQPARGASNGELHLGTRGEIPAGQQSFDDELMHGLSHLSEVARACLLLRTIEGLNYEQIGRVLDIPEGTAMSHVHRSRLRLREHLLSRRGSRVKGPSSATPPASAGRGQE